MITRVVFKYQKPFGERVEVWRGNRKRSYMPRIFWRHRLLSIVRGYRWDVDQYALTVAPPINVIEFRRK